MALLLYCLTIGLLESHRFKVTMYTVIFGSVRLFMANAVILRHSHDCWWILWNFIIENVACIYYFHSAFPFKPLAGRLHGLLTCTIVIRWSDVSIVVCVVYFSGVTKGRQWRQLPPPPAENLSCTAYCYCTILRFTGHALVIEIEPLTQYHYNYSIDSRDGNIMQCFLEVWWHFASCYQRHPDKIILQHS